MTVRAPWADRHPSIPARAFTARGVPVLNCVLDRLQSSGMTHFMLLATVMFSAAGAVPLGPGVRRA